MKFYQIQNTNIREIKPNFDIATKLANEYIMYIYTYDRLWMDIEVIEYISNTTLIYKRNICNSVSLPAIIFDIALYLEAT